MELILPTAQKRHQSIKPGKPVKVKLYGRSYHTTLAASAKYSPEIGESQNARNRAQNYRNNETFMVMIYMLQQQSISSGKS
jgi:hypothetical protein